MNIIYDFINHALCRNLFSDDNDIEVEQKSNMTYVDGEEGDYGTIEYFHDGNLVVTRMIYGGDHEEMEYTDYGKQLLCQKVNDLLIKKYNPN